MSETPNTTIRTDFSRAPRGQIWAWGPRGTAVGTDYVSTALLVVADDE
jgi:hypothetical protein